MEKKRKKKRNHPITNTVFIRAVLLAPFFINSSTPPHPDVFYSYTYKPIHRGVHFTSQISSKEVFCLKVIGQMLSNLPPSTIR